MKIEINDIEFKNNQHEIAVLLTHPKKETILILSKSLPGSETYLEYNDQSNAVYDGITEVLIDGNILVINLNGEGIQKIGHKTIQVKLSLPENDYSDFLEYLNIIFATCVRISDKLFIPSKSKSIDYSKIKYLNIDGKNLSHPPDNLVHYISLEKLFIIDNPKLDVNATIAILANLPHLRQLQINVYGSIPNDLSKLTALESLHIEGEADFETLPTDIGNLKKLNYIYLQSKKPIVLPLQFSDLTALEFLHVRSKTWKLPDNFYKLSHLKHLDLYNCDITVFPSEMIQMTHLETIILGTNLERDDSILFAVLGQLPALRNIEIDISSLTESISDCTQIENLEIYGNDNQGQKFYLPKSFGRLTRLKSLTLENCIFDQLPECLFDVVSLRQLHLTNCTFKEIPEQISKLEHLEEISIIDCTAFSDIHTAFSKLKSLRKIYFENVPALQSLPTELHNLTDIDELYLSEYEKIDNVPDHWIKIMNENGG
jgi:Leucine-rich repeat (LRR) protein